MNRHARFKAAINMACSKVSIKFSELDRHRGVRDFEIETDFSKDPKEIAADALDALTQRDGRSFDQAVCLAVVEFLDKTAGAPKEDPTRTMRMEALAQVLIQGGSRHAFLSWAATWYS